MKADTHPNYHEVDVKCSCGAAFKVNSAYKKDSMQLEICSNCHPFYTGKQKMVDTAGRVDSFQKKFGDRFARRKSSPKAEKKEDDKA